MAAVPSTPPFAAAPPLGPDAELPPLLRARVEGGQGTGIVVGILEPAGKRILAYGTFAIGDARPVDGDTVFDLGSITKVFTALALADMAERGEVALDDPVERYLPAAVHLQARGARPITLADLATHTAGLPPRPPDLDSNDPQQAQGYPAALLYRFLSSYLPTQEPGTHYQYSSVGYGLLGEVLARRAGRSYEQLLEERITEPLGMHETHIAPTAAMLSHTPTGYDAQRRPLPHERFDVLAPAGALRSSANDLLKFLEAALGYRPSALSKALQAMLATHRPGGSPPPGAVQRPGVTEIALGWNLYSSHGRQIVWKNGSVPGFRAFMGYDPAARRGVVALINAQSAAGADDIGLHLLDANIKVDRQAEDDKR